MAAFSAKTTKITRYVFLYALPFLFVLSAHASSPTLHFEIPASVIAGSDFPLKILLDSDAPLNAYDISFEYPLDIMQFKSFENGHSVINIWQTLPLAKDGLIKFSGASLSPFKGKGEILTINFNALRSGTAKIYFEKSAVYLADGKGTKVVPKVQDLLNFAVTEAPANATATALSGSEPEKEIIEKDSVPPEIKFLSFVPDPFTPAQKLLSFLVFDEQSGVKTTMARARTWFFWSEWREVVNPQALESGVWSVDFKAVDNQNNISEKTVYDWAAFARGPLILLIFSALMAALIINRVVKRKKRYSN